jgi:hypothetical protein
MDEKVEKAVKAALKALYSVLDELPEEGKKAASKLASLVGYGQPKKEEVKKALDDMIAILSDLDVPEVKAAFDSAVDLFKADKKADYGYAPCPECGQTKGHKKGCPVAEQYGKKPVKKLMTEGTLIEAVEGSGGQEWQVQLITEGCSANRNYYPAEVLQKAVPLFDGVKCYADHSDGTTTRSVRDIVGWFEQPQYNERGIQARLCVLESESWFKDKLLEAWKRGRPDLIQFSLHGEGKYRYSREDGKLVAFVESIEKVHSVDAVTEAAAGGKVLRLIHSKEESNRMEELEKMTMEELKEARPDLYEALAKEVKESVLKEIESEKAKAEPDQSKVDELEARYQRLEEQYKRTEAAVVLREALAAAELPEPLKERVRESFDGRTDFTREDVEAAIEKERDIYAKLVPAPKPIWTPGVKVGDSQEDQFRKAMDGFFEGKAVDGVRPFRSLREAYAVIHGISPFDVDPITMLQEARRYDSGIGNKRLMEALTTSSWAQVLGDSITRKLLKEYEQPGYDEWKLIVSDIVPVSDFRTNRRMRIGGYGTLSAVSEGSNYSPLTSPGDEEATYSVSKRGGTESVTLEMIANDDVGAIRRIPVKLAMAAKVTLYQFVFDFLRTNATCSYDSTALFHSSHSNLGSGILDDTALTLAKTAMRKQTAYGASSQYPGFTPKYLIVPPELEARAIALRDGDYRWEPSSAAYTNQINVHKGTFELIVVEYLSGTDPDMWFLVADPKRWQTIEIGFFAGRETPELLTQDQEYVGNVFDADKITYKIRFIFGGAIIDHRPFYGYLG